MVIVWNTLVFHKRSKKFVGNKNVANTGYDLIICGYFCFGFIDFLFNGLADFTNLFSPHNFEKIDKKV